MAKPAPSWSLLAGSRQLPATWNASKLLRRTATCRNFFADTLFGADTRFSRFQLGRAVLCVEWNRDVQRRPASCQARDRQVTAEGLGPVFEPNQS
jgi:hypothetical protein